MKDQENSNQMEALGSGLSDTVSRLSQAAQDVLSERQRHVEVEGWTPEHDDQHASGELALAAAVYAAHASTQTAIEQNNFFTHFLREVQGFVADCWPWQRKWWKPADPRRNLVKAGALILAEIERLDRRG